MTKDISRKEQELRLEGVGKGEVEKVLCEQLQERHTETSRGTEVLTSTNIVLLLPQEISCK